MTAETTIRPWSTPPRNSLLSPSRTSFVGFDTSAAAVPYLASWADSAPPDTFERVAALVDRLARRLENALGADSDASDETAGDVIR